MIELFKQAFEEAKQNPWEALMATVTCGAMFFMFYITYIILWAIAG
tara:strand:- start:353 stop:490 length:138 start_codon:yes stop_codon:yes gene_type:complete